jgi:quinol-cytochrome oxidoreductase complex cytochrome b subunit
MENSLIKSDIFFVVTTIAVAVITFGLAVVIFYAIRISKDINFLSRRAKEEGEKILDDVKILRETAESKSVGFLAKLYNAFSTSSKSKTNKKKNN